MDDFLHQNYSSVEASIPLVIEPASETDKALGSRMATEIQYDDAKDMPELGDKAVETWFRMVDAKLNAILQILHTEHSDFRKLPHRRVELSGSGMKVFGPDQFPEGTLVEMRVVLPSTPSAAMYLTGEVVKSVADAIYVKYLQMNEDIRDRIIHFVFLRQREILRGKKEA